MIEPFVIESGLPDPATFPVDELAACFAAALDDRPQYGGLDDLSLTHGPVGLRSLIGPHPDQVLLTAGAAHAISLVVRAFVSPGDVVAVDCPTWDYILRDLQLAGSTVVPVSMDDLDSLATIRPKLLYVIPNFNVPTGTVLSLERRRRLAELAVEHDILVLEDDVYGAIRFDGDALPTLRAMAPEQVIRVDTFSKTLLPGLRLGWAGGTAAHMAALAAVRRDLGVSHLTAMAVERYLRSGAYPAHLRRVCERYREKRDVAVSALADVGIRCTPPAGGFFLWLELPDGADGAAVHARAAAQGVVCRPGPRFFPEGSTEGDRFLRLSFTEPSLDDLRRAAEVLGAAL